MYKVKFTTTDNREFTCYLSADNSVQAIELAVSRVRNQFPWITIKTLKIRVFKKALDK